MNSNIEELETYNIIAVEKENNIKTSLKEINSSKYSLSKYNNLKDVCNIITTGNYHILIIDISNITKSELAILKKIRQENSDLYIILIINTDECSITLKELKSLSVQGYCEKNNKLNQLPLFVETAVKSIEQMKMIKTMNKELLSSKEQLVKSYLESIEILRYTVEAKDTYTRGHSERVSEYSMLIGKRLGLSQNDIRTLKIGGLFHDIGKIGISDTILLKKGKLSTEEYNEIKKHPTIGKNILSNAAIFQDIIPIVLYHHERYDGKGYPDGLYDKDIPLLARIVCVADSFDAMTSRRSYRNELDLNYVKNEIKSKSGTQFDPIIATTFLDLLNNDYRLILEIKNRY